MSQATRKCSGLAITASGRRPRSHQRRIPRAVGADEHDPIRKTKIDGPSPPTRDSQ